MVLHKHVRLIFIFIMADTSIIDRQVLVLVLVLVLVPMLAPLSLHFLPLLPACLQQKLTLMAVG